MATIQGEFRANGLPRNGATVSLFPTTAAFSPHNPPQENDLAPAGALQSTTTGAQHGSEGAWRFLGVSASEYYVNIVWNGLSTWTYVNGTAAAYAPNVTGSVTLTAIVTGAMIEGMGLSYSTTASGFVNVPTRYACLMGLMTAFTPTATGADTAEVPVPYHPDDGTTVLTYNVRRIQWRASASGSVAGTLNIEKSTGTGVFGPSTVGTLPLPAATYETGTNPAAQTVQSGNKLRANITSGLVPSATNWTLQVLLETSS